jgi:hypothetical protein
MSTTPVVLTTLIIFKANDQEVELPNLRSGMDESVIKNAATVTGTLYDANGVAVPDFENVSFIFIADGTYRGHVSEAFDPPEGSYVLKIHAVENDDDLNIQYKVKVKLNKG